jgi:DNA (cytosine-5)-methyltransferase 1
MHKGPRGTEAIESNHVIVSPRLRRLTPRECERLQGFSDDYTQIPWRNKPAEDCPDGPRYKAMGNSMAVPVMRWIGERIEMVEELPV